MLHEFTRPLNEQEQELLSVTITECNQQINQLPIRALFTSLLVCTMASVFMLWAGPYVAVSTGIVIGGAITICVNNSEKRQILTTKRRFEDALNRNVAHILHIQSNEVAVVYEHFDNCVYAFQADDNRIVVISNPINDDEPDSFPNTDFSVVSILDTSGAAILDWLIYKQGEKLEPIRRIQTKELSRLRYPHHMEVIQGRLGDLEQLLAK